MRNKQKRIDESNSSSGGSSGGVAFVQRDSRNRILTGMV